MTKQRIITCSKCGLAQSPDNKYCHDCGVKLPQGCAAIRPAHALLAGTILTLILTVTSTGPATPIPQLLAIAAVNLTLWAIIPAIILALARRK